MSGSTPTAVVAEVPLIASPQTLSISLAGTVYNLTVAWNKPAQCWVLDVADMTNTTIVQGIPLVTGTDLLEQYAYLNFGGSLFVQSDGDLTAVPTFSNLGSQGHLYFVVSTI